MNNSSSSHFPALSAPPEMRLIVCLARTKLDSEQSVRAGELLRGQLDWDEFLALAWRHALMPLVLSNLLSSFAQLVPTAHLQKVREDYQHNAARNTLLLSELSGILGDFESHGIAAIPYKGPALALRVYGDLRLRSFVDLDVLVRRRDAARAGTLLSGRGYRPHLQLSPAQEAMLSHSKCDRVYLRNGRNFVIELHWSIVPSYFSVALETEEVLTDCARVEMCGRKVSVPSPEVLLVLLCINGTKDLWTTLETVCSVNELVRRYSELDWERVITLSRRVGLLRMLHVGLLLAHQIFDLPLPEKILAMINADRMAKTLVTDAVVRLSQNEIHAPGLIEKTRFQIWSRERGRDKVRYCALRLLTPSYRDCSPELPVSLSFLYYGIRPLRLLRDGLKRPADRAVL